MNYYGKTASQGYAIGKIFVMKKADNIIRRVHIDSVDNEVARFEAAKQTAYEQLGQLYDKAITEVGESSAAIFEVHQMMLEDEDYLDSIINIIKSQELNAEYAVATTGDNFSNMFAAMDDEYMKARAADIKDISERLVRILSSNGGSETSLSEPAIIVADDLAPSETVQLDKDKVLGFVTRKGSTNSHTAILARTMNIPALVGVDIPDSVDGMMAVINTDGSEIIVEPTKEQIEKFTAKKNEDEEKKKLLFELKGRKTITKSGREIKLYANVGGVGDIAAVLKNDAAGIGLFRSEFLYLEKDHYPTEMEQFQVYRQVAEMMAGKKVIIRTLDIGADKQIDYFELDKEDNPALGYRAVRICLTREEIFRTQLKALYQASAYGNIAIMIPMIASLWEVKKCKEIAAEVREELKNGGFTIGEVEFGIMIETPAAVMIADELAKEVDFFSIGTNDLTQYTLAIDRQNPKLDMFYDAHHPAVLRLIQMTVDSAHKAGIWAGICGELGADLELTEQFVKMGVDELSVSPAKILPVRNVIVNMD